MPSDPTLSLTDDAFLGGRLRMLQPRDGYRAGLDAVLLAATVQGDAAAGALRVVDAGAGVGVVGLCVAARLAQARVVLVEREAGLVDIARQNIERNGLSDRIEVVTGDVTGPLSAFDTTAAGRETATHVLANPPFTPTGRGSASPNPLKAAAHQMPDHDLDCWARFCAHVLMPAGVAAVIHRADALRSVLEAMSGRFGSLAVLPIHPRAGEPANRIIVTGVKGSRAPMSIRSGLVLHAQDGKAFRPEIEAILRDGAALGP
jgi:tRNA1(Val) A37 N6-methylase TrmN6